MAATITEENVMNMMQSLRVASSTAMDDVRDLLNAYIVEMDISGVYVADIKEPLCWQAAKLYCKAHYGYDMDTERFRVAFSSIRDSMALSGDYRKPEENTDV